MHKDSLPEDIAIRQQQQLRVTNAEKEWQDRGYFTIFT